MEVCVAQWWAHAETTQCSVEVEFFGLRAANIALHTCGASERVVRHRGLKKEGGIVERESQVHSSTSLAFLCSCTEFSLFLISDTSGRMFVRN